MKRKTSHSRECTDRRQKWQGLLKKKKKKEEAFGVIPWESPERYGNRNSYPFSLSYGSTLIFLVIIIGIV